MPAARFITYNARQWRFSELARAHRIPVGTLHARINRFGDTATGIARSLATGILTREAAGRRGAQQSPWRNKKAPYGAVD
jgi:hypothetical protein